MANGHGGYRRPANPAPVSGPGALAKRTDTGPKQAISTAPDQSYGDAKQQAMDQRTAPMQGSSPLPPTPQPQAAPQGQSDQAPSAPPFQSAGEFDRPSERPNEPVTHGVPIGPGAGTEALSLPQTDIAAPANGSMTRMLGDLAATDTSGAIAALYDAARTGGY